MYYISNKGLFKEGDKEENLAVTVAVSASCFKADCKTSHPIAPIRPVTARPATH